MIATDIAVEVMEMVELYCELLLARANVLDQLAFGEKGTRARLRAKELYKKQTQPHAGSASGSNTKATESSGSRFGFSWLGGSQKKETVDDAGLLDDEDDTYMDTALDEAATVVFYAWHRFPHELRELTMLRTMLGERYGKEFMALAQDNKIDTVKVPDRLLKGLRVRPPGQELVESYLREIAKAYGVAWPEEEVIQEDLGSAPPEFVDDTQGHGDGDENNGGDLPTTPAKPRADATDSRRASETNELSKATPPRGPASGRSPVSVAPPAPRTDNPNPRVKVPGSEGNGSAKATPGAAGSQRKSSNGGIPELDELTRRFADLRRKP